MAFHELVCAGCVRRHSIKVMAAGGITTCDDVRELQKLDIRAALGMAIYTGRLDLATLAAMQ